MTRAGIKSYSAKEVRKYFFQGEILTISRSAYGPEWKLFLFKPIDPAPSIPMKNLEISTEQK